MGKEAKVAKESNTLPRPNRRRQDGRAVKRKDDCPTIKALLETPEAELPAANVENIARGYKSPPKTLPKPFNGRPDKVLRRLKRSLRAARKDLARYEAMTDAQAAAEGASYGPIAEVLEAQRPGLRLRRNRDGMPTGMGPKTGRCSSLLTRPGPRCRMGLLVRLWARLRRCAPDRGAAVMPVVWTSIHVSTADANFLAPVYLPRLSSSPLFPLDLSQDPSYLPLPSAFVTIPYALASSSLYLPLRVISINSAKQHRTAARHAQPPPTPPSTTPRVQSDGLNRFPVGRAARRNQEQRLPLRGSGR